jgi:dethiobiotin synthetase
MTSTFIVAGTDTNVGKTVFSAALARALCAHYWKPVQSGLEGETDAETVRRLGGLAGERILSSVHMLRTPASPHIAARIDGVEVRRHELDLPAVDGPLVVETAGGVMVPMSAHLLQIDVLASWQRPVIVCARTALGTINHSLLTLEALRRRRVPVHGIAFIGEAEPEVETTIVDLGHTRRLGRLPVIGALDAASLERAFAASFDISDFQQSE